MLGVMWVLRAPGGRPRRARQLTHCDGPLRAGTARPAPPGVESGGPPAFAGRSPRPCRWWQLEADSEPVALGRAPAPRPKGESDPRGPLAQPSPPSLPPSSSTRLLGKGYSWVCPTGAQHGARVTLMSASQSVLVRRRGGLCLRLDKRPGPALCVCVGGGRSRPHWPPESALPEPTRGLRRGPETPARARLPRPPGALAAPLAMSRCRCGS